MRCGSRLSATSLFVISTYRAAWSVDAHRGVVGSTSDPSHARFSGLPKCCRRMSVIVAYCVPHSSILCDTH
jgi:hypothetical protein